MKYLKIYEEFDNEEELIHFLNKYYRSGYISKSSIKKLDEIGFKYDNFKMLRDDIEKCYSFINKNDTELLYDLFLECLDELTIPKENLNFQFSIKYNAGYPINDISTQPKNQYEYKMMDVEELVCTSILKLSNSIQAEINHLETNIENYDKKGEGNKIWVNVKKGDLRRLKSNPHRKLSAVTPQIFIFFDYNDEYNPYINYIQSLSDFVYKNQKIISDSINRYLISIGSSYTFSSVIALNFNYDQAGIKIDLK